MKFYGNVPRSLKDSILYIRVGDWLAHEVATSDTKHDVSFRKHLKTIQKWLTGTTRFPFCKAKIFHLNSYLGYSPGAKVLSPPKRQTGSGVHPGSYWMDNGALSLAVERRRQKAEYSPQSSVDIKNEWGNISIPRTPSWHAYEQQGHSLDYC
jgi:hypothetical protein